MKHLSRIICRVMGHRDVTKSFDARGRRVEVTRCCRCGRVDYDRLTIKPRNRAMRRRWARDVARELAR